MDGYDWKRPTDAMKGYKSPVDIYYRDILGSVKEAADNYIMAEIKMYVDVDKDELIKAMNYDRDQYATGYRNGYADAQKYGKWLPLFNGEYTGGAYWFECSECKCVVTGGLQSGNRFCKGCGAKMEDGK